MFASSVLMAVWAGSGSDDVNLRAFCKAIVRRTDYAGTLHSTDQWRPLPPLGQTSREGADPLWPHPCDDDGRLAVAVVISQAILVGRFLLRSRGSPSALASTEKI
jgi:hypothetical protein